MVVPLEFREMLDETLVRQGWPESFCLILKRSVVCQVGTLAWEPHLPSDEVCSALS